MTGGKTISKHSYPDVFTGIDLSDPYAEHVQPATRALLNSSLYCRLDEWPYAESGKGIIPEIIKSSRFILAIDGPQGLAGSPDATMRTAEKQLGTAGKSTYGFLPPGFPYSGFIKGSVKLYYSLYKSGRFRLCGCSGISRAECNLIEVYPGKAWPVINGRPLGDKKSTIRGRIERFKLLRSRGVSFPAVFTNINPPSHDQLDAALAAYIAYLFVNDRTVDYGERPFADSACRVLREGVIVQPY